MSSSDHSASVYDVAAAAGVSTASVSRYFRSPERVSPATRERVERAVIALNYIPSGLARGLAERRTGMIGLYSFSGHEPDELERAPRGPAGTVGLSLDADAPPLFPLYADEVLHGIEVECTLRRLPLAIGWQDSDGKGVRLDDIAQRCDGLIVLPATVEEKQLALLARRMPVVLVSQAAPVGVPAVSVTVDNEGGMGALVRHLVEAHDARTFWWAGNSAGPGEFLSRFHGLAEALSEAGLTAPQEPVIHTGSRYEAHHAMQALLSNQPDLIRRLPDAIVCASDQTALGVIAALREHGVEVPRDVIVTGFDGIAAGQIAHPTLTTVRQPMQDLGREAVAMLDDLVSQSREAESVVLPVTLRIGRSCGC